MKKKYLSQRIAVLSIVLICLLSILVVFLIYKTLDGDISIWVLMLFITASCSFLTLAYQLVLKPYRQLAKTLNLFAAGYTIDDVFALNYSLNPEMDKVLQRLFDYLETDQMLEANKNQAQYLALQNQINPHFLYNALEGIRGEALAAGQTNISNMTEALSTFFRYTISNVENTVTLKEELDSVNNYFFIQKYRFENRFSLEIALPNDNLDKVKKIQMPKLVLQPIVENAIVHGIEPKTGNGNIKIKVEETPSRMIITVSDNGVGIADEQLIRLNSELNKRSFDYVKDQEGKGGGIALLNVNNRLKLIYGEGFGISLYSALGIGTDVEIIIPTIFDELKS